MNIPQIILTVNGGFVYEVLATSITVNGERRAICRVCFDRWNKMHRTDKGLEPIPLDPQAYEACNESEL